MKVYTRCLRPDLEYKTMSVRYTTTCRDVVDQLLNKYRMKHRDPNLFFLTMEVATRSTGQWKSRGCKFRRSGSRILACIFTALTYLLTPRRQLHGRSGTRRYASMPPRRLPPTGRRPASCERWCRRPADRRSVPRDSVGANPSAAKAALDHPLDLPTSALMNFLSFGIHCNVI